ncbi:protein cycle [Coccinella septempunctata]|uniref:protein cycle n=1 Tax=Coccinella septempunctata TaxID=41139 RepID=UPI001D06B10E|nr:protein cycle [Coccinella septempunctata]
MNDMCLLYKILNNIVVQFIYEIFQSEVDSCIEGEQNFPMQDQSYETLLQIPDADGDLITFEELRPVKHSSFDQSYESFYDSSCLQNPCSSGLYKTDITDANQPLDGSDLHEVDTTVSCGSRKRKASIKQNHSEIEKRRRDKMNTYITELSSMIPMCSSISRKVDKITVLRMAVEYLKTIRGPAHSYTETHYKPPYITDQELKHLILQVAEGFLFVVGCDRGKILYISESVSKVLHFSQNDLLRQSLFDIVHPKDVAKVKEQLSSSEHNPREKFMGSRISRLCPGARRSFFCRMKRNISQIQDKFNMGGDDKEEDNQITGRKYAVIHCTGYLKSWHPSTIGIDEQDNDVDGDSYNVSCLIAVGHIINNIATTATASQQRINTKPIQFISKHTLDGKFHFVDQRVTLVLGFLPQELLGCSIYEYFHPEDIPVLAETHETVLQSTERFYTKPYRFKTKDGGFVDIQSEWRAFKNPWTKEIEYLISKNNLVIDWEKIEINGPRTQPVDDLDFMNERNQLPQAENTDEGIIKLMEDVTKKPPNIKQQSDGNDEAAMAIIMSLLEVDAGLGGPVDFSGLPWPLP